MSSNPNTLLVQLLTQPHLQSSEASRTGASTSSSSNLFSDKYVLSLQSSCTMMSKVQLEQAIDMNTSALQKELHEQRLKNLRKLVKYIEETDWMYEDADKLIGLSPNPAVKKVVEPRTLTVIGESRSPPSPFVLTSFDELINMVTQ